MYKAVGWNEAFLDVIWDQIDFIAPIIRSTSRSPLSLFRETTELRPLRIMVTSYIQKKKTFRGRRPLQSKTLFDKAGGSLKFTHGFFAFCQRRALQPF